MQPVHELLFGEFPRSVATPIQQLVYSDTEFEMVFDSLVDNSNIYSSIGQRWPGGRTRCDKVFFDFDTPYKVDGTFQHEEFDELMDQPEKVSYMREHTEVAEDILGGVLEDAKVLIRETVDRDIPLVSTFSGGGIHVHQLYQPEEKPKQKMNSTGWYFTEELELTTADTKIFGDTKRLTRVPNAQRMDEMGRPCNLYLRPYTADEMLERDVEDLLRESKQPRESFDYTPADRPEMQVYEGYPSKRTPTTDNSTGVTEPTKPINIDEDRKEWLEHIVKMPCLAVHASKDSPEHDVRWSLVAYLFNVGATREEVFWVIERLGWSNFDADKTRYMIDSIWKGGQKNEHSCRWMMQNGYCVYQDPTNCPTHEWGGSEAYMDWEEK